MGIFDEKLLERLCSRYKIRYKIFDTTNIAILDSGLDEWMIKYEENKDHPYCLMHKNKLKQTKRYHVQKYLRTLEQLIDRVIGHKLVLSKIYGSTPIHKRKYNNRNTKIKKKGRISKVN